MHKTGEKIPTQRREGGRKILPLVEELLDFPSTNVEEELVFFNDIIPGGRPQVWAGPAPNSSWAVQTGFDEGGGEEAKSKKKY